MQHGLHECIQFTNHLKEKFVMSLISSTPQSSLTFLVTSPLWHDTIFLLLAVRSGSHYCPLLLHPLCFRVQWIMHLEIPFCTCLFVFLSALRVSSPIRTLMELSGDSFLKIVLAYRTACQQHVAVQFCTLYKTDALKQERFRAETYSLHISGVHMGGWAVVPPRDPAVEKLSLGCPLGSKNACKGALLV